MFGISIGELLLVGVVALMVVGPSKLPKMLSTLGHWIGKLRRITTEVRHQTGIDELLRQEGLKGGLSELRGLVRGDMGSFQRIGQAVASRPAPRAATASAASRPPLTSSATDPYKGVPHDRSREYPPEGCDAYGCLPDDLWEDFDAAANASPTNLETTIPRPSTTVAR